MILQYEDQDIVLLMGNIHFVRQVKVLQRRKGRKNRVCKTMIIANKSWIYPAFEEA